jgi:Domain of unknown function (DUF222)/HNH endonuclease
MSMAESPVVDPFGSALSTARSALSDLSDAPTWSVPDETIADRIIEANALVSAAQELACRLVAEADSRRVPDTAGATSTAAWLDQLVVCGRRDAGTLTRTALAISRRYDLVRVALADGAISLGHARVICAALERLPVGVSQELLITAQQHLLEQARILDPRRLAILGKRLWELIDPESVDAHEAALLEAEEARAARQTWLTARTIDGVTHFRISTPQLVGHSFMTMLEAFAAPRRTDANGPDTRPYPARLGQAFTELLSRINPDALPDHGGPPAHLVITIDHDHLVSGLGAATMPGGDKISASQARWLACTANLIPAVLDGNSVPLDLGRSQRLYTPAQRIALAIRDAGCVFPGCSRPPSWTETHHILPWSDGGPTDLSTGCLLCAHHHHLIHEGHWTIVMTADGHPSVIPPPWIDEQRTPQRNTYFRHKPKPRP